MVQPSDPVVTDLDLALMRRTLELADQAALMGEVPVGALVVRGGLIISQAFNLRESLHDPTAHAERIALTLAGRSLNTWRLDGATLYVSLEPCSMCAGAIIQSRVERVVYGAFDRKAGACDSLYRLTIDPRLNNRTVTIGGILADECAMRLSRFFIERRRSS
jgi:tRNA(adenine34) deaminase